MAEKGRMAVKENGRFWENWGRRGGASNVKMIVAKYWIFSVVSGGFPIVLNTIKQGRCLERD